jgi:hypothetical protein
MRVILRANQPIMAIFRQSVDEPGGIKLKRLVAHALRLPRLYRPRNHGSWIRRNLRANVNVKLKESRSVRED